MTLPEPTVVGKRGRRKTGAKVERRPLPGDAFNIEDTDPDERGAIRRTRGERTEQQQAVDAKVLEVYKEWKADGSPSDWLDMPVKKWAIASQYVDDAIFMLGKAASHHGKKLVLGTVTNKDEHNRPYPDGKMRIPFCVIDRVKQKDSVSNPTSLTDS